ncbi:MAG: acetyl-CoA carboxylase biotin carboxyl carrier protein [Deferribacteraceae bacterium]|nr:acetyl-CoA carboxylase biotin carboxyl carrier protein [Deferribacteraceae bacterium]
MNLKEMKDLIEFFDKSGLTELEIEDGDNRLYVSKNSNIAPMQYAPAAMPQMIAPQATPAIAAQADTKAVESGNTIESPIIGTYYSAASPGAAPFINVGDIVEKGQTLCIIEAMKIMNTIEAEYRCKIVKMLVENGKPVEYGQPIFVVEPQ